MRRNWPASLYLASIAVAGFVLWGSAVVLQRPWETAGPGTFENTAILLALTILSGFSPIETSQGVLTVTLAPLCGAVALQLDPWAVMTVAALGTIDRRRPGQGIPWSSFAFNRGMWIVACGVPSILLALTRSNGSARPLAIIGAIVLLLFLNTTMMAIAIRLLRGLPLLTVLRGALAGNALTFFAMPLLGILIVQLMQGNAAARLVVFLLYGPLLIYRTSMQKQRQLDTWLRDSYIMQSRVVDKRDGQTFGHSQRVGELCEAVARSLGMSEGECNTIRIGGILHDLGKIAIPDSILLKPGKLTPEEYEIIKTHPVEGAQILAEHPEQRNVADILRHHHERWDGAGYPDGLAGQAIPIGSRIVNACDAFDTITQARVFRPTVKTPEEAIRELRSLGGSWYDPRVIDALEKIVQERWGVVLEPQSIAGERRLTYRELLRSRPFRLLWVGQAVSYFGDMMNTTGLAIMLYLITRSPSLVALGLIAKAAPTILLGLVAGVVVDRFDRQKLMIVADMVRAPLTIAIPFLAVKWLPGLFIDVFLIAVASCFFNPAKQAMIPNLVPARSLGSANGLVSSSEKAMELVGYTSAGLIVAAISWLPLFLIDGATYIVSAATLLGVADRVRPGHKEELRLVRQIKDGLQVIKGSVTLRSTLALTFFTVFFAGLMYPVLVVMAYGPLHANALGYGLLEAAIGAGAVFGGLLAAEAMNRLSAGRLILVGVAGWGAAAAVFAFSRDIWTGIVFMLLSGLANMLYFVPLVTVTQREAPDRLRGRVMSSRFLLVQSAYLLGMALAGPLTKELGAPLVFAAAGGLLIVAALVGLAFPSLRDATIREEHEAPLLEATVSG